MSNSAIFGIAVAAMVAMVGLIWLSHRLGLSAGKRGEGAGFAVNGTGGTHADCGSDAGGCD